MIISLLGVWLLGSIFFPVQETNHAELMEHEASLSRNAQEEKLSLQQVLKDITQVLVSLLFMVTRLCLTPPQASWSSQLCPDFHSLKYLGLESCGDDCSEHI